MQNTYTVIVVQLNQQGTHNNSGKYIFYHVIIQNLTFIQKYFTK